MPSLNALHTFHAVAREGSLTAAAAELGVTTSAVSRQIRNLEECVGVALLIRNGRGMRLTADGRALEGGLQDAFSAIATAVHRLQQPARGERLRVTVPPVFASAWLIPRLQRFNTSRPEIEVILVDSGERVGVSDTSEVVVGWGLYADETTALAERLSGPEEMFPLCARQACPAGDLSGATLLHRQTVGTPWVWPTWPSFLEAVGLDGVDAHAGPSLTPGLLLDAARTGRGVMLANTTIAHDELSSGRLVRPVAESLRVEEAYWLLTARAACDRPEVSAFRDWLKGEFETCFGQQH
jgi:LysR family glycine cleavage system transcriptional activator